ncbi:MAG: VWA domain-containing protein [Elusimicrobia bacterium]|nr:VWA domain-containing protein [Elusimicrobiota bacterium]
MRNWIVAAGVCGLLSAGRAAAAPDAARPAVDLVFAIDTTGSMGGLIEGAKAKVWAIANEVMQGRPAPRLRMGLVAYRDKGDAYVAKAFELSENLDAMYAELLALRAEGGGDGPEHVIAGLEQAVEKLSWSRDPRALKVVFLVGDAPPHEDYPEAPKLDAVLHAAMLRGIRVNAVQCGDWAQTSEAWRRIARLGEGRYLAIPQDGGVVARPTPFDERIAALSSRLEASRLAWGEGRKKAEDEMALSSRVGGMLAGAAAAPAAAERALFKAREGFGTAGDLAEAVEGKTVSLDAVKDADLPEELRPLAPAARRARIDRILAERRGLKKEVAKLQARRARFLAEEGPRKADAFDARLVETLKRQAAKAGIAY